MSLKILGGFAKGFLIDTPKGDSFRPTLSTLKRRVFDRYQNLAGYSFFDCFAGSGAVGLEAVSRGSVKLYLFEKNFKHFQYTKKNIERFKEKYSQKELFQIEAIKKDFLKISIEEVLKKELSQKVFFIDPPYERDDLYLETCDRLKNVRASFWIEGDSTKGLSAEDIISQSFIKDEVYHKIYRQGDHYIICIDRDKI